MDQIQELISNAVEIGISRGLAKQTIELKKLDFDLLEDKHARLFYIDFDDYINIGTNTFQSITIDYADLPKFKSVSLFQASIQKTYYMISEPYNTMLVNGVDTITVPPGNYTSATLITQLTSLLNALAYGAWTLTFNQITGKITFVNATLGMIFTFTGVSDLNLRLGFSDGTHSFVANTLVSTRQINLQLTNVIVVESNLVKSRAQNSINQNILMTIPDTSTIASPVVFENPDPYNLRVPMENTGQIFRISLYDANNRPLGIQSGCNLVLAFYR